MQHEELPSGSILHIHLCLLQKTAPTTLDVTTCRIILCVLTILPSDLLELVGKNGKNSKERAHNYAPCHLSNIVEKIDPILSSITANLSCMLCNWAQGAITMIMYNTRSTDGTCDVLCHILTRSRKKYGHTQSVPMAGDSKVH